MNCKEASNLFSDKRLGTISHEDQQALEEHFSHCQSCQKQWEAYSLLFSDTRIEDDFPIPSQLNAKIKYTIHQAKNTKKVPFFRSKQILSYATACCFLLVAGIWGTTHFSQMKENLNTPLLASETHLEQTKKVQPTHSQPEMHTEDVADVQPQIKTQQPVLKNTPTSTPVNSRRALVPESQPEQVNTSVAEPLLDQENLKMAEDSQNAVDFGSAGGSSSYEPMVETDHSATFARQTTNEVAIAEQPADIKIDTQFQTALLEGYPYTQITDSVYRITITKAELEEILQETIPLEEKTEYIIEFASEN